MRKIRSVVVGIFAFLGILYLSGTLKLLASQTRGEADDAQQAALRQEEASNEQEPAFCVGSWRNWRRLLVRQVILQDSLSDSADPVWDAVFTLEQTVKPKEQDTYSQARAVMLEFARLREEKVYSFLQGPYSWEQRLAWSGEWCNFMQGENRFGNFGCGLCCMANVYSSLSPYEASPWDMLNYARETTYYTPSAGNGAIDWSMMQQALWQCGMNCSLYQKPGNFETFRNHVRYSEAMIVLVNSANDDTYWTTTGGHYVCIWLYDEGSETVFLSDSSNPDHNRRRIPLQYVYNALKTASAYQYLMVEGYDEEDNVWKGNGIDENWCRP